MFIPTRRSITCEFSVSYRRAFIWQMQRKSKVQYATDMRRRFSMALDQAR